MSAKSRKYFLTYQWNREDGSSGVGDATMELPEPVEKLSLANLDWFRDQMMQSGSFSQVIISNIYQLADD